MDNNNIITFTSPDGAIIRTLTEDGRTLFNGTDVCNVLGYGNTRDALARHCKGGVVKRDTPTSSGVQPMSYISEPDMYRLVMRSKLPEAERFEAWVAEEVLPAIRKDGGYMVARSGETPEQVMARAVLIAQATIERMTKQLEEAKPKVVFADAVSDSDTTILIGELAKLIKQNGKDIGQNRLFYWMRANGYLMKSNMPTQRAMDLGLFRVIERTKSIVKNGVEQDIITRTTKVIGKGQIYFIKKFKDYEAG